ncbi:MAG TPA: PEGA domain-containing protein [Kofleriaceae bacterium]|nr:PEGA domain-containing protein [Kofleriaceae bacterium]
MKRSLVLLITLIAMAIARPAAAKPSVAVLGLEVTDTGSASGGVDAKSTQFAAALTDVLRARAKITSGPFSLAAGSDKDLVEMKLLSGCDNEANDCMSAIGGELVADRLLYGHVEKQAKGYQVSLKLLNVGTKRTEFSTSDLIPYTETSGRALDGWGKTLYAKVTGASTQGGLVVKANVARGSVYLDGVVRGNLSGGVARITGLDAGDYQLRVEADCYLSSESKISIEGGKDTEAPVDLAKNTLSDCGGTGTGLSGPPGGGGTIRGSISSSASPGRGYRVLFWTTAAIAAGAGATWGYAYFGKIGPDEKKWNDAGGPSTDSCDETDFYASNAAGKAACDDGQKWSKRTYVAIPITAAAGAAAMYFFYRGYVSTPSATGQERIVRRKSRGSNVVVAPVVTATDLGGVVHIEF